MGKHLLFVYGTLKRGQPNCRQFGDLAKGWFQFEGVGETVDRYPLVVASSWHIPFVLAKKGTGEHVLGELYSVDEAQLAALDALEEHPTFYTRTEIPVRVVAEPQKELKTDSVVQAGIYLLFDFIPELLKLPFLKSYGDSEEPGRKYTQPTNAPMTEVKLKKK